jgi:four helix bundle protein
MIKQNNTKFDLEERTSIFGEKIIGFCQKTRITLIIEPLIKQLIRSATSIGANYMEANGSDSKRDFRNKISICKKEAKETTYWLRMLANSLPDKKQELRIYWTEAHELSLIFAAIINKIR